MFQESFECLLVYKVPGYSMDKMSCFYRPCHRWMFGQWCQVCGGKAHSGPCSSCMTSPKCWHPLLEAFNSCWLHLASIYQVVAPVLGLLPKQWWSQVCEPVATIKSWTVVLESPNEMSNGHGLDYMWFLKIHLGVPPLWSFICVSPSDHLLRSVNISCLLKANKKKIWVMAD